MRREWDDGMAEEDLKRLETVCKTLKHLPWCSKQLANNNNNTNCCSNDDMFKFYCIQHNNKYHIKQNNGNNQKKSTASIAIIIRSMWLGLGYDPRLLRNKDSSICGWSISFDYCCCFLNNAENSLIRLSFCSHSETHREFNYIPKVSKIKRRKMMLLRSSFDDSSWNWCDD